MRPGRVSLVGAGPGDPGLLTVRALERLREAEVIVYDRLVNPELLDLAPPEALRVFAGKRVGHHCLPQSSINSLLVHHAGAGRFVVRLKGGDPFVFGRGGEEALALSKAGIPFEVVPGISSAIGLIPKDSRCPARQWASPGNSRGPDSLGNDRGAGGTGWYARRYCWARAGTRGTRGCRDRRCRYTSGPPRLDGRGGDSG